jgi:malate dehydrogenase (oxaloacetate-decarboxylating)
MDYRIIVDDKGPSQIEVGVTDYSLLSNPLLNKGMAFTDAERAEFKLHGLLPPHIASIEDQELRSYTALKAKSTDLGKYVYLRDLQDSNETLFYHLVNKHIEEILPLIYTPTVGEGCIHFGRIYRRPRGLFISYPNRNRIDEILSNPRFNHVEVIVVSDGERILGLGDQGAGGMGIPIGKLGLYTACAGIHPMHTLPILLDTGTDNPEHIKEPLYIGWRHERVRGSEYDAFIDQFVTAVKKRFPHVLLQWEDFAQRNASPILEKYRNALCTFNDDIQGTAAIATGTLLSAIRVTKTPLKDQRIVVAGAGSAGCGISSLILQAMIDEGLPEKEALKKFFLIDRSGLLREGMDDLLPFQKRFAHSKEDVAGWKCSQPGTISFADAVNNVKPTLLIGVSGQPGLFSEEIIRSMAKSTARPVIFPLSNPTSRSEATPSDLFKWTEGRAIIGTGSPFPEIVKNGKPFRIDQTNNAYIFPGMGLGLIVCKARHVTDRMFMAAAKALADCSPAKTNPEANLLPPLTQIREVSFQVALAVAKEAIASGEAQATPSHLEQAIKTKMWAPAYLPYKKIS